MIVAAWMIGTYEDEPEAWHLFALMFAFFLIFSFKDFYPLISENKARILQDREEAKKAAADLQAQSVSLTSSQNRRPTTSSGRPAVAPFEV